MVNKEEKLFIDKHCTKGSESRYISYRMVICHAIHHNLKERGFTQEQIKENLAELLKKLGKEKIQNDKFFEAYPIFNTFHGNMILVIDKSEGCYPLVLHDGQTSENRISAFKESLENVDKKFDKIIGVIENSTGFNNVLHDKLNEFFIFPESAEKKKGSFKGIS